MFGETFQRFLIGMLFSVTQVCEQRQHDGLEVGNGHESSVQPKSTPTRWGVILLTKKWRSIRKSWSDFAHVSLDNERQVSLGGGHQRADQRIRFAENGDVR